jgi:peptide/nickel transport system substrate-binding protein
MRKISWSRAGLGWIASLALVVGAAGCGSKGGAGVAWHDTNPLPADAMTVPVEQVGSYGGRFVIAQTSAPKTFNAIMANETSSTDLTQLLFTTLADFNNLTQKDIPMLAKTWDVSPDNLTWTWHLRRGARFSDGHPLTAEDVLFSFEVCYDDTLHPSIQDLIKVSGKKFELSAPDSYTVVMKIASPYALMVPACGSVRIMPKHVLEPAYRSGHFAAAYVVSMNPDSVVTSGPWRVKSYAPNEKTVLARNPYWFGVDTGGHRLPYLDELVFLIVPDQNTAALKFQSGELDGLDDVKPEDYKSYTDNQAKGDYTLYDLGPSLNTNFFWFNLNKVHTASPGKKVGATQVDALHYSWFSNPNFRKAVSMAVDRDAIIKSVLFGEAVKNWSQSTPGNKLWYSPDVTHYDYDPDQAKKLLAGMGWKDKNGDGILEDTKGNPIRFSLKTNSGNTLRVSMCNFIKDDLAKVGIECTPAPVEFNTLITNLREDFQYESILLGLQSGVPPDPGMGQNVWKSSGLTHYWNIKQPHPETPAEAEVDKLIGENVATNDSTIRHTTWKRIQDITNEQAFIIWLPTLKVKIPVRNQFGNVRPTVIPHRILWNVDQIFAKPRTSHA